MHERNPYRNSPPDFQALAQEFPFLQPHVTINPNGKPYLDFRNPESLKALTKALLLKDYQIEINYGPETLVPTVPLRLNYILWIEDLFKQTKDQVRGLDIGTGSTAIYALVCAAKNQWKMIGTDINDESIEVAQQNVKSNHLENLVTIQKSNGMYFADIEGTLDFSMCNPPFFSSEIELNPNTNVRKKERPKPSGAKTGLTTELVVEGGEVQFIKDMIKESSLNTEKCRIFTTMIGIQKHLKILIHELQKLQNCKVTHTTFRQGKTFRWGLAWTFSQAIDFEFTDTEKKKTKPVILPLDCRCPIEEFRHLVKDILKDLEIRLEEKEDCYRAVAYKNTWSHQRRRKRQQQRISESNTPLEVQEPDSKVPKMSDDTDATSNISTINDSTEPLVEFTFTIDDDPDPDKRCVSFCFLNGVAGKDTLHQISQYVRNKWNSHYC